MVELDLRHAHDTALRIFGDRVRGVGDEMWGEATPCAEWDVRELVSHNVGENHWAGELFAGRTIEDVGDRFSGDQLGDDAVAAYERSAAAAREALADPEALERDVHVSYGPVPGWVYAQHRYIDLLVHAWDLAVATGQDPALPDELAEAAYATMREEEEQVRASGVFGDAVAVGDDAPVTEKLVAFLGRDPAAWT